jgi:hypothetical protein
LTPSQEAALAALVRAGRLVRVAADLAKAARFLASARTGLADLTTSAASLSPRSRHRLAYDAAHDAVEALLAAYGYKTANGPGVGIALNPRWGFGAASFWVRWSAHGPCASVWG